MTFFVLALHADPNDNPADPLNHDGFVGYVFSVLLDRDPEPDELAAHVNRLENREWTRGELVADVSGDSGFDAVRQVVAAYRLALGEAPTLAQFQEGLAKLDTIDEPDLDDALDLRGLPPGLVSLLDEILASPEFWFKYSQNGYDMSPGLFVDVIRENLGRHWESYAQREEEVAAATASGHLQYLIDLFVVEIGQGLQRALYDTAFILLFLERGASRVELNQSDRLSAEASADSIVTIGGRYWKEFCQLHGGDCFERMEGWLTRHGGLEAVREEIPDHVEPLLRFALGVTPREYASDRLPQLVSRRQDPGEPPLPPSENPEDPPSDDPVEPMAQSQGEDDELMIWALRFERPTYLEGVRYILETSEDLRTWNRVETKLDVIGNNPHVAREIVELHEAAPPVDPERRFFRLRPELEEDVSSLTQGP